MVFHDDCQQRSEEQLTELSAQIAAMDRHPHNMFSPAAFLESFVCSRVEFTPRLVYLDAYHTMTSSGEGMRHFVVESTVAHGGHRCESDVHFSLSSQGPICPRTSIGS